VCTSLDQGLFTFGSVFEKPIRKPSKKREVPEQSFAAGEDARRHIKVLCAELHHEKRFRHLVYALILVSRCSIAELLPGRAYYTFTTGRQRPFCDRDWPF
jgi:hypothetical protein